jgi:hypothetical protein
MGIRKPSLSYEEVRRRAEHQTSAGQPASPVNAAEHHSAPAAAPAADRPGANSNSAAPTPALKLPEDPPAAPAESTEHRDETAAQKEPAPSTESAGPEPAAPEPKVTLPKEPPAAPAESTEHRDETAAQEESAPSTESAKTHTAPVTEERPSAAELSPAVSKQETGRPLPTPAPKPAVSPAPEEQPAKPPPDRAPSSPAAVAAAPSERPKSVSKATHKTPAAVPAYGKDKVQLFLSVPIPAAGISRSFDILKQNHRPEKAVQLILRRALTQYEHKIGDGTFKSLPADYEADAGSNQNALVQTSRTMPGPLAEIARAHFDPLGFESERTFGRKIATAALATFFENEKKT